MFLNKFFIAFFSIILCLFNNGKEAKERAIVKILIYKRPNKVTFIETILNNSKLLVTQGSGVFINKKGGIITNYHVINGAEKIEVFFNNKFFTASVLKHDSETDLALLQINAIASIDFVTLNEDVTPVLNNEYFTISYPQNKKRIKESARVISKDSLIVFLGKVSYGSSGGALIDENNNLLGIISYVDNKGYSYAVPLSKINQFLELKQ